MYILFDIGGTHTRIARSRDGKTFNAPTVFLTPQDFNEGMALFQKTIDELRETEKINAMGGGIAGSLDIQKTMMANSPHLPAWIEKPLKGKLEVIARAPVFLENDATLAGLGEVKRGAAKGAKIAAYITVGTGVGGARFIEGKTDRNAFGFEPGHQIIHFSSQEGNYGESLEAYISGAALKKRYGEKFYETLDGSQWDELARFLAYGISNVIVFWSPDVCVLGGSMITKEKAIPLDRVSFYVRKICTIFPRLPEIKKSSLGDFAGLYGALAFLDEYANPSKQLANA